MLRRTDVDERGKPHLGLKDFFFVGAFLEENRSCQELNVERADCFHTRTLGKSEGIVQERRHRGYSISDDGRNS